MTVRQFETRLVSGKKARVMRIEVQSLEVMPLFLTEASTAENTLAAELGMARHHAHTVASTPDYLGRGMSPLPLAQQMLDSPEDMQHPVLGPLRLYSRRARVCAAGQSHRMAPLHLLRLAAAQLEADELLVNASHFQFLPPEFDCLWNAYGDPIGLVVAAGVVHLPPQLPRSCLLSTGLAFDIQALSFADISVQLPDGKSLAAHPFGKPLGNSEHRAFALFHGSVNGATPIDSKACDVAYAGRWALAMKTGGGMPIPTSGCVLRFATRAAAEQAALSGPVSYRLPLAVDSAVQTGPLLVRDGRSTRNETADILHREAMSPATELPDTAVLSPYDWKADWDATSAARLSAAVDASGALFLCVVEGGSSFFKSSAVPGATLNDLAELMREQGAQKALHLDGGGSTQVFGPGGGALVQCGDLHHGFEQRAAQYDRPLPLALRIR